MEYRFESCTQGINMISAASIETARNTTLQLLKKTTGDNETTDKSTAADSGDPFEQLFATDLGMADTAEEKDDTYQPVPPKVKPPTVTTASGKIVEGLVDSGGDASDDFGNQIPVAFHIAWHGLEVARIYASGSVTASSSFDYSSIFANEPPEIQNLFGADLVKARLAQYLDFFSHQS